VLSHTGDPDAFLRRADLDMAAGADILDIVGTEGPDGLARRVEALAARFEVPISVHTGDADALEAALAAGAVLVAGGELGDPDFLRTVLKVGASVVARPLKGEAVRADIEEMVASAREAGFAADEIIVDTGLALAGSPAQSTALLRHSGGFAALGHPLLLSVSGSAFLAGTAPDVHREIPLVAAAYGMAHGCRILRVHDVAGTVRVARTIERILEARPERGDPPK
jgi:dihydropteroate synthase